MTVNKVILVGKLGKDPAVRDTSGDKVANFSIATDDSYKDRQGNRKEVTDWANVVCWGKLADFAATYLKKGSWVYCEGKLKTRSYDKDRNKVYVTEVKADVIRFVGPNPKKESEPQGQQTAIPEEDSDIPF